MEEVKNTRTAQLSNAITPNVHEIEAANGVSGTNTRTAYVSNETKHTVLGHEAETTTAVIQANAYDNCRHPPLSSRSPTSGSVAEQ